MMNSSILPSALMERWNIQASALIADTHSSLIHRVKRRDGTSAIVKQLKPSGLRELSGIDFLQWRQGHGAIELIDRHETACLLQDAGMITLRAYRLEHGEDASNTVIVSLLCKLHDTTRTPPPATLVSLRAHFAALFDGAAHHHDSALSEALIFSANIAEDLLAHQTDVRPLHGDFHHENIITGTGPQWLAIDPQGLIGDPAYDVANIFGNPEGAFDDIIRPERINALVRLFASAIGCGEEKILRYAIAHAGLSICWSLEGGDSLSAGNNATERFAFLKVARQILLTQTFSA